MWGIIKMDWNSDILKLGINNKSQWFELGRNVSYEISHITDSIKDTFYPTPSQLKQTADTLGISTHDARLALNIFNSTDIDTDSKSLPAVVPIINKHKQSMVHKIAVSNEWIYQDNNQEPLVHSADWNCNVVRYLFEGFGDIFRELSKVNYQDTGYINEKIRRWDNYINRRIHSDDTIETAMVKDHDKFEQMLTLWNNQPTSTQEQRVAKWLNLRLSEGDITGIEINIDILRNLKQVGDKVVF
jgi:hypothetical protein